MDRELAERMFDANVQIEGVWPIPAGEPSEMLMRAFEYEDALPRGLSGLVVRWSKEEAAELFSGDRDAREAWSELFAACFNHGVFGYACKAWTPVYSPDRSYSWGYTQSEIFFGATSEDVLRAACDWAEAQLGKAVA